MNSFLIFNVTLTSLCGVGSRHPKDPEYNLANIASNTLDGITVRVVTCSDMDRPLNDLGRYAGPATLILSSLAEGPKHGYALMKDIEAFSGVQLQPGTLYGAIQRLELQGLIEPLAEEGRRRPYRMTTQGAVVLQDHLRAQRQISEVGLHRLSIGWTTV